MKPRYIALLTLLALYALSGLCMAQTIRTLGYNSTNFIVQGWTNTNALTFSNAVALVVGSGIPPLLTTVDEEVRIDGNLTMRANTTTLQLGPSTNFWSIGWEVGTTTNGAIITGALDFANATNKSVTRSNLFGSAGISTNIQIVRVGGATNTLVFSNGLLHQVTTP